MDKLNLLKEFGSPLYVYDHNILVDRCKQMEDFRKKLQNNLNGNVSVSMHYSTKANNNPAILLEVKAAGLNVDCMSELELVINERCGFTPERMLYVCNNISAEEMKIVHDKGILICLDSISQVETWGKLFPGTDIMVRINPGTIGVGHSEKVITSGKSTKFGICENNLHLLFEVASKNNLNIIGVHQHLGSLFLNDKIPNYIAGVEAGLNIIKKHFKDVRIVDLGGGFGVPYTPDESPLDLSLVSSELVPLLNSFINDYPSIKEFKFEPGRFIPCESGVLLGTITAVKYENDTWWIGTDIGMNQLVRPSMYDSYHQISIIPVLEDSLGGLVAEVNFCGNVCESGDILGKNRKIALPCTGDIVAVENSGAYGFSMASNYTGRARPAEVMVYNDGTTKIIRKRETIEDIIGNIVW